MRFEIKAGGAFVILIGLAVLSGAVFALGLMAGYEIASQSPANSSQVAEDYPVPTPMAQGSPAAASTPGAIAAAAAATPAVAAPSNAAVLTLATPAAHPVATPAARVAALALNPPAREAERSKPAARAGAEVSKKTPLAVAEARAARPMAPAAPRRRGYHIQIEAAMDRGGAEQMVQRLRSLGYTPEIVPTRISGEIWYTVEIGPYATIADAQAAQVSLRQKYAARFAGH